MSASKIKKNRFCKRCRRAIYGDAKKLKEHIELHRLADRAQKSGLILPDMSIIRV